MPGGGVNAGIVTTGRAIDNEARSCLIVRTMRTGTFLPLWRSFVVCRRFFPAVLGLGLIAALGRITQEGAAGDVSATARWVLEIVVEASRVFLLLYLLGGGNVETGWARVRDFVRRRREGRAALPGALRARTRVLLVSFVGFAVVAGVANVAIFAIARNWSALPMLQHCGWIAAQAGNYVTVLFLKNLSVIPWTLAFVVVLTRWLMEERAESP